MTDVTAGEGCNKARARKLRSRAVNLLLSYNAAGLGAKLRSLRIGAGDAILMQSSFHNMNSFDGEALDVIDCALNVIGPDGRKSLTSRERLGRGVHWSARPAPRPLPQRD